MIKRLPAIIAVCLTLAGCILQSREPLFDDGGAALALAPLGEAFASYSWADEAWQKEDGALRFTREGKHYTASEGASTMSVTFAAISGSWWVMQSQEPGKPAAYSLADIRDDEVMIHPIACKPLRESGRFAAAIDFKDDDCFIRDGADSAAMFRTLAAEAGKPTLRLVPLR